MFDSIRKHQRLLQFVLLLLILPAFVFFGVSGYKGFSGDDGRVATVMGEPISRQEFDQAQRQQLDRMRQMFGDQVDPKMLDTEQSRSETLEGLITQRALFADAVAKHLDVPVEKLRETIMEIPGLKKPDGSFDMERYRALLSAQNLNEATFESQLRRDLAVQTNPEALGQTGIVPRAVLDRLVALQEEAREVRELPFKAEKFAGEVKVDDEAIKRYYDEHASIYQNPETARVEYVVLDTESIAGQITVDPKQVRDYYDANKERYGLPEQRQVSHIQFTMPAGASDDARKAIRAKAEGVLKQIRGGADFAALAKGNSDDKGSASKGGDIGFIYRHLMAKPFGDAVWSLKTGEVSDVVESDSNLHLIKVVAIKPGEARPFESVKADIEEQFRKQEATKEFAKMAEQFTNTVYEQSDSLKPAAEKFKLKIQTAADVGRAGPMGQAKADAKSPLGNPKLLGELFSAESIKSKRNTDAIEVAPNTLVSARIVEHRPSERKPLEAVKGDVRERVVALESAKLAVAAGTARLKELQDGAAPSGLGEPKSVKRSEAAASKLPPAALEQIFKAPIAKLPAYVGVDLGPDGYSVFQLAKVTPATEADVAAKRGNYEQQFAQFVAQQEVAAYLDALKARSKVKRSADAIARKE